MRVPKDKRSTRLYKGTRYNSAPRWATCDAGAEHASDSAGAAARRLGWMSIEVVKEAFDKFDEDGSGTMEVDELEAMLSHELREPVPEEELQRQSKRWIPTKWCGGLQEFLDWFTSDK